MNVQSEKLDQPVVIPVRGIFLYAGTDTCNCNSGLMNYNNHRKVSFCRDYWLMGGETGGLNYGIVK